jgi:Fe2+ transport system protein B
VDVLANQVFLTCSARLREVILLLEAAAHRPESFALGALYVGGISSATAFEVQVLADGIVE